MNLLQFDQNFSELYVFILLKYLYFNNENKTKQK